MATGKAGFNYKMLFLVDIRTVTFTYVHKMSGYINTMPFARFVSNPCALRGQMENMNVKMDML